MHSDLHGNVVHHGVELLLLVFMLFLLAIPKSHLILKEFYTLVFQSLMHVLLIHQSSQASAYLMYGNNSMGVGGVLLSDLLHVSNC